MLEKGEAVEEAGRPEVVWRKEKGERKGKCRERRGSGGGRKPEGVRRRKKQKLKVKVGRRRDNGGGRKAKGSQ
jgi:hypothetical protein